jgi:hypothetical protein
MNTYVITGFVQAFGSAMNWGIEMIKKLRPVKNLPEFKKLP